MRENSDLKKEILSNHLIQLESNTVKLANVQQAQSTIENKEPIDIVKKEEEKQY